MVLTTHIKIQFKSSCGLQDQFNEFRNHLLVYLYQTQITHTSQKRFSSHITAIFAPRLYLWYSVNLRTRHLACSVSNNTSSYSEQQYKIRTKLRGVRVFLFILLVNLKIVDISGCLLLMNMLQLRQHSISATQIAHYTHIFVRPIFVLRCDRFWHY